MNCSIVLADDHASVRSGFRMILESAGMRVLGEASTGVDAVSMTLKVQPDVVFMDIQMPDLDGVDATAQIVKSGSRSRVVVVTTFDRDDYLFAALDAGASGFLLKTAGPEDLISAARIVASGDALLAPEVTRRVIERRVGNGVIGGAEFGLTERESEVLKLLASAKSNAEIAAELYIGDATVKTHVSNVLLKLGVRDRLGAVVFAHQHGMA